MQYPLKEELHHKPKVSMFCTLFQNYQHFLKNIIHKHFKANFQRNSKMTWKFQKAKQFFWVIDQTFKILFWSATQQELLGFLNFNAIWGFSNNAEIILQNSVDNLILRTKTCSILGLRYSSTLKLSTIQYQHKIYKHKRAFCTISFFALYCYSVIVKGQVL